MKIAITGASGKTGYRVAEEAIKAGHDVQLLIRKNSILPESLEKCNKSVINLDKTEELESVLKDRDALIIATGARPSIDLTGPARVDAFGVRNQVKSCNKVGLKRVLLVSSLCTGKFFHPLNLFGLILIWKKIGEDSLIQSGLDWTIIRPGGLLEREDELQNEGIKYTSEGIQEEGSIPRRLVAKCCVESLNTSSTQSKIIEITSEKGLPQITLKEAISKFSQQAS